MFRMVQKRAARGGFSRRADIAETPIGCTNQVQMKWHTDTDKNKIVVAHGWFRHGSVLRSIITDVVHTVPCSGGKI